MAFAKAFGEVINEQVWEPADGDPFKTLSFRESEDTGTAVYVHYSSKLGEISEEELIREVDNLQVVELVVDPETLARRASKGQQLESYRLCRKGELNFGKRIHLFG